MFNKEWYNSKNTSKELTIGWLYNDNIRDDFAKGYTKNMTDYWSVEMSWFLPTCFEDSNINNLLKKAHDAGFKKIVVFKQGTTLGQFQAIFPKFYDANKNATFVGHILDQQDSYYTIHPQAFMIDLTWWAKAGFPEWGAHDRHSIEESFETIEPIRSNENWHDEYTPHWIAPSKKLRTYKRKLGGWNIVKALMEDGQHIISWNKEIREEKHYSYPEVVHDGPRHLPGVTDQLMLDIFFIANTELPPPLDIWLNHKKQLEPTWDGNFNRLVVPAAGLSPLIYAFTLGMPKGSKIYVYDISKFALDLTKRIIEEWNGSNYSGFAKDLMKEYGETASRRRDMFRGTYQLDDSDETIKELNEQGFSEWLTDVLPTLEIFYHPLNIMDPNRSKRFAKVAKFDEQTTYVHLSNIYHYMPTSFYYSLQQRWALHNELISHFKSVSDNNNILIYSACPIGYRSIINWVDDWDDTIQFDDLPDDSIGKFLKWNKATK
jgi:hypothetical protein